MQNIIATLQQVHIPSKSFKAWITYLIQSLMVIFLPHSMSTGSIYHSNMFIPTKNLTTFTHSLETKLGIPYFCKLNLEDEVDSMLKVFIIDCTDCPNSIELRIHQLKSHVQGVYGYGKAQSGFMHIKDLMDGNQDGPATAFTTGLNLFNSWCVSPVAHSVEKDDVTTMSPDGSSNFIYSLVILHNILC